MKAPHHDVGKDNGRGSRAGRAGGVRPGRNKVARTEATRGALLEAARALFVQSGYAGSATPQVVARAGVTRGALYHHFEHKRELFRAVLEREARAVAQEVERAVTIGATVHEALMRACLAYLGAMQVPGRTRLLLIDGPAVLGVREAAALDEAHAAHTLREGLRKALGPRGDTLSPGALAAMADLLVAAIDRAALAVETGAPQADYQAMMRWLIDGLLQHVPEVRPAAPSRRA